MKKTIVIAIVVTVAIVLTAVAGYRLGIHIAHVREVERMEKFCDAALTESTNWLKVYDETGDGTAYWKAASALGTYISIYEQLKDEDPERSEVANANVEVLYRLKGLLYSHEEECKAEMESLRTCLMLHHIYPYGLWPGDLQETHKLIQLCNRIEEAAKD